MATGFSFTCSRCKRTYSANWGIGTDFPLEYSRTLKAVKEGKYGEEWQKLYKENAGAAVDAVQYVYVCKRCGNWAEEQGLAMYVPRTESGKEPAACVYSFDLKADYRLLRQYIHRCKKCNGVMRRAEDHELENLCCPVCGGAPAEPASLKNLGM